MNTYTIANKYHALTMTIGLNQSGAGKTMIYKLIVDDKSKYIVGNGIVFKDEDKTISGIIISVGWKYVTIEVISKGTTKKSKAF